MNEKRYNLTKFRNILAIGLIVFFAVFLWLAWPQIGAYDWGYYVYGIVAVAVTVFTWGYTTHMVKMERAEKPCIGVTAIQTIAKYQFLLEQLVSRDFKVKYKRSVLGVFWSFLNPLLMMLVQYFVFSNLFDLKDAAINHYPIYLLCGIITFNGFNDSTTQSMRSITSNASLITKVYVPKYIYPVSKVLSASINLLLSMVPLLLVTLVYGLFASPTVFLWSPALLLLPIALVLLVMFTMGFSFILSSLMVFFHDIEFLWGVLTTMWMYATPIMYSIKLIENKSYMLAQILRFNPLYHYVDFVRTIVIDGKSPEMSTYLICGGFSVGMLLIGVLVFKKTQDKFILHI